MSKIQDALRKMQSLNPVVPSVDRQGPSEAPEPIGKVINDADATGVWLKIDDSRLIVVDRDKLRQSGYLPPVQQERHVAEQYRLLKRPLIDNASGRGAAMGDDANLVMVTSALPGDGKTFNCINLALSMAVEKDVSVLLVDADVAKPHVSQLFGVDDQPGLIESLKSRTVKIDKLVMRTDIPGLRILPAGCHEEHATELLASKRMGTIISELSKTYADRIVIFDSPPMLVTSEARVLASHMGQIAMIVCAGRTPQQAVQEAIENLDETKAISLILNQSASGQGVGGYGAYGTYGIYQ